MATTKVMTTEDVAQLPDDEFRYALFRGVLYRMPLPVARHGRVVGTIGRLVGSFVVEHCLGVVYDQNGFIFECDPDTLLGPALSFVQSAHVPADEDSYPELAPDLVVEIISPSQTGPSIEEKTSIYLAVGVRLVWVVDPVRGTVRIHRADGTDHLLTERDVLDGEDVLPGFHVPIAQFFA
ncbi:MAG: Uma2 family endonuclease [Chloroflexia bacterium]|nr:Uma2 family endonuclease [Chloroflexia bacterium]